MLKFKVAHVAVGNADSTELLPEVRFSVQTDQISLRDLIARTVEQQIADLLDDQEQSVRDAQLLLDKQYLNEQEVHDQASTGKISMPQIHPVKQKSINISNEINRAHRAFEQQRYMIFINGQQLLDLDDSISYKEAIDVKFMRLIPLAGG